jgi:tripartite-type tricarboxylate transporter receptor subunit TctC
LIAVKVGAKAYTSLTNKRETVTMPLNLRFSIEKTRRWALLVAVFLNALAMLTLNVQAQSAETNFPTQSIKILIGFSPGGSSDTVARIMVPKLTELFKQTVVIDNKPGAGGNIATDLLTKATPDGHTIMLGTVGSLSVNQHLNKLNYDPVMDTAALSLCVVFSNVLVVNSASDVKTFEDYLKQARQDNSKMSFGSSGIGGGGHLAGEMLKIAANLNNQHVAYRGGAPAMNDLLGGVLPSIFSSPTDAVQHIQTGKLRPLATTGSKRLEALPNVPTIAESGFPGFEATNWYAFAAPAKTSPEVIRRLNAALVATLKDPGVVAQLRKLGLEPTPTSPVEAARFIKAESDKWGSVVRKANIKGS